MNIQENGIHINYVRVVGGWRVGRLTTYHILYGDEWLFENM